MFLCVFCLCSSSYVVVSHICTTTTTPFVRCSRICVSHTTRKKRGTRITGRRRRRQRRRRRETKKMMWRGGGGGGGGGGAFLRAPQPPKRYSSFGRGVGQNHHRFDDSWSSSSLKKRRARGGGGVGGFKGGRMKSAGDGIDGVSTDEEKVVVRFGTILIVEKMRAEKRAAKGTPHLKKKRTTTTCFETQTNWKIESDDSINTSDGRPWIFR